MKSMSARGSDKQDGVFPDVSRRAGVSQRSCLSACMHEFAGAVRAQRQSRRGASVGQVIENHALCSSASLGHIHITSGPSIQAESNRVSLVSQSCCAGFG